jgi:hypothetical protein
MAVVGNPSDEELRALFRRAYETAQNSTVNRDDARVVEAIPSPAERLLEIETHSTAQAALPYHLFFKSFVATKQILTPKLRRTNGTAFS